MKQDKLAKEAENVVKAMTILAKSFKDKYDAKKEEHKAAEKAYTKANTDLVTAEKDK